MARSESVKKLGLDRSLETDERRLIEAAQSDRARFVDVYEKYFELVYGYVARRTRDRAAAEDLTSEVFRKALANLPRWKWTGAPFAAWLFRIASNLIADRAKRAAREGSTEFVAIPGPTGSGSSGYQHAELEDAERRARLSGLVAALAEDQRRVVLLRFNEEKSIKEIAGELGRTEGAVKQLQFRALHSLRKQLTDSEEIRR